MISIIICSANPEHLHAVSANIKETIGVKYEILAFDNSAQQKGICEVYNKGVQDANYSIVCFIHEDVELHTPSWGLKVIEAFSKNDRLGLLGIAGSSYKSFSPSGWDSTAMREKINFTNLVQKYKYAQSKSERILKTQHVSGSTSVAVVDGVWLCSKREILTQHPFDQQLLKKFHGYDIDISLSIGQTHNVEVTSEVLLTHFSEGNYNKEWVKEMLLLHKKWMAHLPVNKAGLTKSDCIKCEKKAFKSFISTMRKSGYSSSSCIWVLNESGIRDKFGWGVYAALLKKCLTA